MRNTFTFVGLALVSFLVACGPTHVVVQTETPPPPPPAITFQTFYDALSPYGQWVDYPGDGYVWIPNVGPDFRPYGSAGNWVYSDEGWAWVSDYPWGWAPFHYGSWFLDNEYGWCWIPGYQWAPAWVTWRRSDDYYGWAPIGPAAYDPPPQTWCFVPRTYVNSPHVTNYYVAPVQNVTIIRQTTVINNYTVINKTVNNVTVINNRNQYGTGPDRAEVETVTHTPIKPVSFRESTTPGGGQVAGGQLTIYRPPVQTQPAAGSAAPAPTRVTPYRPHTQGAPAAGGNPPGGQPNTGNPSGGQPNNSNPNHGNEVVTPPKTTMPPAPVHNQPSAPPPAKGAQPGTGTPPPGKSTQPGQVKVTPPPGKSTQPGQGKGPRRPPKDTTGAHHPH
jgi:hypothetical protein